MVVDTGKMQLLSLVLLFVSGSLPLISGKPHINSENNIRLTVDEQGAYSVNVGSATWLTNAPTFITAGGIRYSTDSSSANKLVLKKTKISSGHDNMGPWTAQVLMYEIGSTSMEVHMVIKQYDTFVIFDQHYMSNITVMGSDVGDKNKVCTGFPSFNITATEDLGFMAYGGLMFGDTHKAAGKWGVDTKKIVSGLDSGPLILFDKTGSAVIISPFRQFMASQVEYDTTSAQQTASWGLLGSMKNIPQNFKYSTIIYFGYQGIRQAIADWGMTLRRNYKRTESYRYSDLTVTHLGYWTDNGAYYYYTTEKNQTYEKTILDVASFIKSKNLPFRYIQYDSWFYPKDGKTNRGGTLEWISMSSIFPQGMQYVYNATQMGVSAHNRWWSNETSYAKKYNFIVEPQTEHAIPQDPAFWDYLMATSKLWGLITYEQDWLNNEFDEMNATTQNVDVARNWLIHMGMGAENNGVTIQYCMAPGRAALQSLEVPVVTQARVSDDYQPGEDNWMIGISAMFADSLGIAPFKDNFWTTPVQPGNIYGKVESHPELHSVAATLSTGPVGPSDSIDKFNISLIMRSCNMDGLLLKPSKPIFAINPQLWQMAYADGSGPEGEVYTTYSNISDIIFGIVLAAAFEPSYSYSLNTRDSALGNDYMAYAYPYNMVGAIGSKFSATAPLSLKGCTRSDFCLYYLSPPLSIMVDGVITEVVLYGEWDKWVPLSPQRVENIDVTSDNVHICLKGASYEKVTFYVSVNGKMMAIQCTMSLAGNACINVKENTCQTYS